jgi:hypothetical protein
VLFRHQWQNILNKINITCLSKDRFFEEVMCEKHTPSFFRSFVGHI